MPNNFTIEKQFNCPQCGYALSLYFKHTKLVQCVSCKSTIFLEDDASEVAGDSSVLAPEISILKVNTPFFYSQKTYLPLGKICYSYGRGFWEEWWVKDTQNNEYWLSVDEGDLVLQQKVDVSYPETLFDRLRVGLVTSDGWVKLNVRALKGHFPKR